MRASRARRKKLSLLFAAAGIFPSAATLANNNLSLLENPQGNYKITSGPDFFAYDDAAIITPATIQQQLFTANTSIHTGTNGANTQPGDILILSPFTAPGLGFSFGAQAARNITGTAVIDNASTGTGGSISMTATSGMISISDLIAHSVNSSGSAVRGGSITLLASTGVTAGALKADSTSGSSSSNTGGNVTITTASGNIQVGSISAETDAGTSNSFAAGNVAATATAGAISISGQINASALSANGSKNAGSVNLHALGALTLGDQVSATSYIGMGTGTAASGGAITLYGSQISLAGRINSSSEVDSAVFSVSGAAGNAGGILITATSSLGASQNIVAYSHSRSGAAGNGGTITITSNGTASFGGYIGAESKVRTSGTAGQGGSILVTAAGNITFTGDVDTFSQSAIGGANTGGFLGADSVGGSISAANFLAYSSSLNNSSSRGGGINVTAAGAISFIAAKSYSLATNGVGGTGGNITLISNTGSISGQIVDASAMSTSSSCGSAGNVTLTAGDSIDISNYLSVAATAVTTSGIAGAVNVTAPNLVHIANLSASATTIGTGGAVTITSDEINLGSGTIAGKGALLLQPFTASRGITVFAASDSAGTLDLLSSDMACLANGFSSITIGKANGSGAISIGTGAVSDPLTVRSPSGSISQTGILTGSDNASITLIANDISFAGAAPAIYTNSNAIALNGSVHLAGNVTLATTNSGTGAPIAINGTIDGSGSLNISAGASSLTLANSNSYSGGTNLLSGKLIVGNSNGIGSGALSIASGAAVTLNASLGQAVSIAGLSVAAGGNLDIKNNSMIVNYSGASPVDSIRAALVSAYDGSAWDGSGISSSDAASDTNYLTAVGYAESSDIAVDTFGGRPINGPAVLLKYTYYGDCNLDGIVTTDDYFAFVAGFNGQGSGWAYGDFNYDGAITTDDLFIFVAGFNQSGAPLSSLDTLILSDASLSTSEKSALLAAVPEPSSLWVALFPGLTGLLARRRSRAASAA